MSKPMVSGTKLVLMNLAVTAAMLYRWLHGAPTVPLVISGLILFTLVNVLLIAAAKSSAPSNK
jgi:hypothetical protein